MHVKGYFSQYAVSDTPFAEGGAAELFRCDRRGLVYKRFREPIRASGSIAQLGKLVHIGRTLLVDEGQVPGSTPEASVNWPIDRVHDPTGSIVGVIIPEIPKKFFTDKGLVRGLDHLILARANPPDAIVRVPVLIRIAEIFSWLDAKDLVYGDFSQKNIVWSGPPEPGAYLIDTDGLKPQSPPPREGLVTPGWTDPRVASGAIPAHDHFSDWYGISLAMYRGLLLNPGNLDRSPDGTWPKPNSFPNDMDPQVRLLIIRSLSHPLEANFRPPPHEWVSTLLKVFVTSKGYDKKKLKVLDDYAERHRKKYRSAPTTFNPLPQVPVASPTPAPVVTPVPPAAKAVTSPAPTNPSRSTTTVPRPASVTSKPPLPSSAATRLDRRLPLALAGTTAAPAVAFPFAVGFLVSGILCLFHAGVAARRAGTIPLGGPADWLMLPVRAVGFTLSFTKALAVQLLSMLWRVLWLMGAGLAVAAVATAGLLAWTSYRGPDAEPPIVPTFVSTLPRFVVSIPVFLLVYLLLSRKDRDRPSSRSAQLMRKIRMAGEGAVTGCWVVFGLVLFAFISMVPHRTWHPYSDYQTASIENPVLRWGYATYDRAMAFYGAESSDPGQDDGLTAEAVATAGIFVRSDPTIATENNVVGSYKPGAAVLPICSTLGDSPDGANKVWVRVETPTPGFVWEGYLRTREGKRGLYTGCP